MKILITLLALMSQNVLANQSCGVCFYLDLAKSSMLHLEIDPIEECSVVKMTIEKSCQDFALSIGSEERPFQDITIEGKKISAVKFKYKVASNSDIKLSEYFSELTISKPNITYKKETNRLFSTFIVTVE